MSNEYMSEPFNKNQCILNDLPTQDLDVNGALEKKIESYPGQLLT